MKKVILIIALLFTVCTVTFAQPVKRDTAKKEKSTAPKQEYQPDPAHVYHIVLDISGEEIDALTAQLVNDLRRNKKLTGDLIGEYEDNNKQWAKTIQHQALIEANEVYKKWQADTAAKAKGDTITLKVKPIKKAKH